MERFKSVRQRSYTYTIMDFKKNKRWLKELWFAAIILKLPVDIY